MAEVLFRARLTREDSSTPWGFRLQGGADYKKPLTLLKVMEGSVAAKSGLHATDIVVRLAGKSADGMTHKGAQEAIMASGNALEIIVERADVTISSPNAPNTPTLPAKTAKKPSNEKRPESPAVKKAVEGQTSPDHTPSTSRAQQQQQPTSSTSSLQQQQLQQQLQQQQPTSSTPTSQQQQQSIPSIVYTSGGDETDSLASSIESNLYIPDSNNNQQLAESVEQEERETFVKDPAEFQVNPFHKPGAKRSTAAAAPASLTSNNSDDNSSGPSSSGGSTESLEAESDTNMDYANNSTLQVQEEKLLATADDTWSNMRRVSQRSPVPPGGETWQDVDESALPPPPPYNFGGEPPLYNLGGEPNSGATPPSPYNFEGGPNGSSAMSLMERETSVESGVYSQVSTTAVQIITTLQAPGDGRTHSEIIEEGEDMYGYRGQHQEQYVDEDHQDAPQSAVDLYPWRMGRRSSREDLLERQGGGELEAHQQQLSEIAEQRASEDHGRDDEDTVHQSRLLDLEQQEAASAAAAVTPSLTFVGRRIAPPPAVALTTPTVVTDTPTSQTSPSPHISVTPSSPPTGLTVLPINPSGVVQRVLSPQQRRLQQQPQYQQHSPTPPDNHQSSSPSPPPPPLTHLHAPYDLPELTQELSDVQQEAARLLSNNEYHSPRLEDIHFSTGGPEVVDIPMPAVKEMVADLNRRLEAIAAQQPQIAEPPTAQEIGLQYIRQRRKELEHEVESQNEKEIFINMPPASDGYGQTYFRSNDSPASNTYQKLYDIPSPIDSSPTLQAYGNGSSDGRQEREPSPRSQHRVHFAEPPEQSVIEIESRSKGRRHRKDNDRGVVDAAGGVGVGGGVGGGANGAGGGAGGRGTSTIPSYSSQSLPEPLTRGCYSLPSPVASYASNTMPVIIERPASRRSPHHPLSPPSGYEPNAAFHNATSSPPPTQPHNQFSISITHKKADQTMPTRMAFTLPSGQPGQPTHFRYTMAGSGSPQQQQQQQQQPLPRSDAALTYSLPPRYEDSMKRMAAAGYTPRSFDDSILPTPGSGSGGVHPRPGDRHRMHRNSIGRAVSPQPGYQSSTPLYVDTAGGPLSPPRASPVYTPQRRPGGSSSSTPGYVGAVRSGVPSPSASPEDAAAAAAAAAAGGVQTQSKSFRALEAHYTDSGRTPDKSRVQILGTPSQGAHDNVPEQQRSYVLQPAAVGRPFSQLQPGSYGPDIRAFTPPAPQGAVPGPPPPGVDLAGAAIGPGLFALFDSSFTDKFMQWQQNPRSHFESETYKLVHEMEGGGRKPRGGATGGGGGGPF